MSQPRYAVRAVRFTCIDESGIDFIGSDEPYFVFTSYDPSRKVHTARSQVFGDVDSGETRKFDAKNDANVFWPHKGASNGAEGSIALSVQLWESDQGNPDNVAKRTEQILTFAEQLPTVGEWVRRVPPIVRDQLLDLIADDIMGSKTILLPMSRLARQLPHAGASLVQKHRLGGSSGDLPFDVAGGPDYDLYLQVTRVA